MLDHAGRAELEIVLDPTGLRLARIWSLRDRMSANDAAYAAVAEALHSPLVTADEPLLPACRHAGIAATYLGELAPRRTSRPAASWPARDGEAGGYPDR